MRPVTKITIVQVSRTDFPVRNKTFILNFIHTGEINSSWQNLTDTAKLKFPKNIYFVDELGNKVTWDGKNISTGTQQTPPLLLRGDKITIELGYINTDVSNNELPIESNIEFQGYITKVINRVPVEIECEDQMYQLKQIKCPNKVFPSATYNTEKILKELLAGTGINVVTGTSEIDAISISVGDFRTQNETVCDVLKRFQKDYHLESYFRMNNSGVWELRCATIAYFPQDQREQVFQFQQTIIKDELEYKRKDDISLGVVAYSINKVELQTVNKSGDLKTKHKRLEVKIGPQDGELRTLYFFDISDVATLTKVATEKMNRLYFEGFSGKFTTFGLPSVRHGDVAVLRDDILPERNGKYLIKEVTKSFGMDGFRQEISLDIRIDLLTASEISAGI